MHNNIWNFWAPNYERLYAQHFSLRPTRHFVLRHLQEVLPHAHAILDLGCGIGQLANELAEQYPSAQVTGIDPATKMIARARRDYAHTRVEYRIGQMEDLAADERFDAVICTHSFPYISNKEQALQRIHKLLHPGGRLIIVQGNTHSLYDRLFYLAVKLTVSKSEYLSTSRISCMLKTAGFSIGAVSPLPCARLMPSIYLIEGIRL